MHLDSSKQGAGCDQQTGCPKLCKDETLDLYLAAIAGGFGVRRVMRGRNSKIDALAAAGRSA